MFHQGDLQSGIALALQEAKSVVCFVRDDGDESDKWENDWLHDQNIPASLQRNAITIRMQAASQEAGFLSAFHPIEQVPAVVIIWQGKVEEQLAAGITKNDFTLRLLRALNRALPRDPPTASEDSSAPPEAPQSTPSAQATETPSSSSHTDRQARIQALLAERATRLAAEKKAQEEATRQAQAASSKARSAATNADGSKTAQRKHAEQEKKRIADAAAEKERVRRLVEADKAERRERQERARAIQLQEREVELQDQNQDELKPNRKGVTIQVRLLNGEAIRATFFPEDTPRQALRDWIDQTRTDGHVQYSFKVIQTPAPSRPLTDADEDKPLRDLGLAPSASLVLVALRGKVATAYTGDSAASRFLATILAFVTGIFGFLGNLITSFVGWGVGAAGENVRRHEGPDAAPGADAIARARAGKKKEAAAGGTGMRVRTLRDQDADRDDQQLYNGNQLNFQPRKDEDDGKDK